MMIVGNETVISGDEAEQLDELAIDMSDSPAARQRYIRRLRKLSGCSYATRHMVTSCGGTYTLVVGRPE
mgnify:CR=1 FL=1